MFCWHKRFWFPLSYELILLLHINMASMRSAQHTGTYIPSRKAAFKTSHTYFFGELVVLGLRAVALREEEVNNASHEHCF